MTSILILRVSNMWLRAVCRMDKLLSCSCAGIGWEGGVRGGVSSIREGGGSTGTTEEEEAACRIASSAFSLCTDDPLARSLMACISDTVRGMLLLVLALGGGTSSDGGGDSFLASSASSLSSKIICGSR